MGDSKPDDTTEADTTDTGSSTEDRFAAIEAKQDEQDSKLDRILSLLPGGDPKAGAPAAGTTDGQSGPAPSDIQSTVREEIAKTQERQAEEARRKGDDDWRASVNEQLEKLKPEKTPRDATPGLKGRLQRAMFGKAD